MMNRITLPATAAALCLALAAPALARPVQQKPDETKVVIKDDTTPKAKKAGQAMSDASVTTAVETRLAKDKAAADTSIHVKTDDGVVTLTGAVPTAADKTRIGSLASHTTGVKRVDNELTISGAPAATSGKDEGTKVVIKNDLPKVKVKNDLPKVEVKDNGPDVVVKDDTTPAVKKGARKVADAEILTSLKTKLLASDDVLADHIDVDVNAGVVTLHGTVPDAAQKAKAADIARNTAGVKTVVNRLTVK